MFSIEKSKSGKLLVRSHFLNKKDGDHCCERSEQRHYFWRSSNSTRASDGKNPVPADFIGSETNCCGLAGWRWTITHRHTPKMAIVVSTISSLKDNSKINFAAFSLYKTSCFLSLLIKNSSLIISRDHFISKIIAFIFSWDHSKCQEKLETMFMQHFGGTNRVLWYFWKWPIDFFKSITTIATL